MKKSKKVKPTLAIKQFLKSMSMVDLKITKEDIESGKPGDGEFCPIAYSAKRTFGPEASVSVDGDTVQVELSFLNESLTYELTKKAENFVYDFDDYKKVKPFKFTARLQ